MSAIFGICGNESQPGLQLVEKLVTPLFADKCRQQKCFKDMIKAIQIISFKIRAKIEVRENFDCGPLRRRVCLCRVVLACDLMQ